MSPAHSFAEFALPASLRQVLSDRGITSPTPIQAATLADALAGRDVLGRGRTGSGKTYAFLLPLVTRLSLAARPRRPGRPRALILAPTRELVRQIEDALAPLAATAGLRSVTVFGGVGERPQISALRAGVDVAVACPGRLEDLIRRGACSLADIEVTVIDEADHMADLGFLPAVTRLMAQAPARGQRMLFSATLDGAVNSLVARFMPDPVRHEADSATGSGPLLAHHVLHVPDTHHFAVLADLAAAPERTVIFTRTKHRAKALARRLNAHGVPAVELHANLSQNARMRSLASFQAGQVTTLVATDIAARGIHVDDVALVVHADPPADAKGYVHRSGRTARAGRAGTVVTLITDAQERDLHRLTRAAGVAPMLTKIDSLHHPLLAALTRGDRPVPGDLHPFAPSPQVTRPGQPSSTGGRGARRRRGLGRPTTTLAPRAPLQEAAAATSHSTARFSVRARRTR